jgi:hypothetical protein
MIMWGVGGLAALGLLVGFGPYPVAMIGVPESDLSNSMPHTLALLALGGAQTGFALALEPVARQMLESARLWTGLVLVNASPMGETGVRLWVVALPFIGTALAGFGPAYDLSQRLR